jgi:hypothetical protein
MYNTVRQALEGAWLTAQKQGRASEAGLLAKVVANLPPGAPLQALENMEALVGQTHDPDARADFARIRNVLAELPETQVA